MAKSSTAFPCSWRATNRAFLVLGLLASSARGLAIAAASNTAFTCGPTAAAAVSAARAIVVVVPDRHGRGTNALLLSPPDAIGPAFGVNSRIAHEEAARAVDALSLEVGGPLALDLDLPEDLTLAEERGLLDPAHGG